VQLWATTKFADNEDGAIMRKNKRERRKEKRGKEN
jgi:hypothetical protein